MTATRREFLKRSAAVGAMLDQAASEEGAFAGQGDNELDLLVQVAARVAVGNVDANSGLAHIARRKHVEASGSHHLHLDGRTTTGYDACGSRYVEQGEGRETSH